MVIQASFFGLFRFIFILVLGYYLFKLIARYVLPYLLGRALKTRFQNNTTERTEFNKANQEEVIMQNEDITIKQAKDNKKNTSSSTSRRDEGEYVEFDELD